MPFPCYILDHEQPAVICPQDNDGSQIQNMSERYPTPIIKDDVHRSGWVLEFDCLSERELKKRMGGRQGGPGGLENKG